MTAINPGRNRPTRPSVYIDPRLHGVEIGNDGYRARYKHLIIIASDAMEEDNRWWRHVSVSRKDKAMPTYDDLLLLKDLTIGAKRIAIQVFPPEQRHIDIAGRLPNPVQVLHLWSPDDDFLPDFARGGNTI